MRPRGEIRVALGLAAVQLGPEGFTWRNLAHVAGVGLEAARQTVLDMSRAGELIVIGHGREAGVNRPMTLYAPAVDSSTEPAADVLNSVVRGWADFR